MPYSHLRLVSGFAIVSCVGLAGMAAFPWGMLKGQMETRLTQKIGRPVTIGSMQRLDVMSFHPRLRLGAVRIPQPAWVQPRLDDLARIAQIDLSFSFWSLLKGQFTVEEISLRGARLQFYRTAQGRRNWSDQKKRHASDHRLQMLQVSDSRLRYLDEKRGRSLDVAVASDHSGLHLEGNGLIGGQPVRIVARGAPIIQWRKRQPWPYTLDIEGPAVGFAINGTMPAPLDLDHLQGQARGHATDC